MAPVFATRYCLRCMLSLPSQNIYGCIPKMNCTTMFFQTPGHEHGDVNRASETTNSCTTCCKILIRAHKHTQRSSRDQADQPKTHSQQIIRNVTIHTNNSKVETRIRVRRTARARSLQLRNPDMSTLYAAQSCTVKVYI